MYMDNTQYETMCFQRIHRVNFTYTENTEGIRTQTELSSYLYAASFASLNDEMNNIFDYMKRRCCEGSFFSIF
jgi:hypothetical protein